MTEALVALFARAADTPRLKAVLLEGEGANFSFGASVEQHLPGSFERMLPGFHAIFDRMLACAVVTLAAVRGQCLGGGLELAAFCHRVFAAPDARLGQPEIALGVVAPVASVILAERIGRGRAEELCLTGRSYTAREALAAGLVDQVDDDPTAAALEWACRYLLPRSSSSLRFAVRAVRTGFAGRFRQDLAEVERLYAEGLMETTDAAEGLRAFLEKRPPQWSDR
ncbi:MAG TPA: enoyl-CoA hydratase-related protein, partial [Candidatus Polarisedimenticolaceae bacterium]|nr:enoyl-CoA hydratase-related protein [Candidatus Polarisedimenticolaceae bacterium]